MLTAASLLLARPLAAWLIEHDLGPRLGTGAVAAGLEAARAAVDERDVLGLAELDALVAALGGDGQRLGELAAEGRAMESST